MASAELGSKHRHAAGGLFALASRQAQLQQCYSTDGFGFPPVIDRPGEEDAHLHEPQLVRHVFRYLGIEEKEWANLESTAVAPKAMHQVSLFMKVLSEEDKESKKLANDAESLARAVDAAVEDAKKNQESSSSSEEKPTGSGTKGGLTEAQVVPNPRKVAVMYTLLAACVSESEEEAEKPGYDARHRVTLRLLALWFDMEWAKVAAMEMMVAYMAMAAEKEMEKKDPEKKSRWKKWKRGGIIGAAAVTGGALLFVTGGLAAPAIAAGMEAVAVGIPVLGASGLTAAAAVAGSGAIGSTAVAASFGAAGAGLTGKKMAKRTGDIDEFEFEKLGSNHGKGRLAVEIVVSGIAFDVDDFYEPWQAPDADSERYALRWESEVVFEASTAIQDMLKQTATQQAIKQGAMFTVLGGLVTAMASPLLALGATKVIDSKWGMALDRSEKAGKLLASILLQGGQGNRPVTLMGFALGARIIFKCLQELAQHGDEGMGIVERVIVLGMPQTLDKATWASVRKVVAGRFVNGFSKNDWVLGVVYRANFMTNRLAGLEPVNFPGIENVDLSDLVDGHSSYLTSLKHILQGIDLDSFHSTRPHKLHLTEEEKNKAKSTPAGPDA